MGGQPINQPRRRHISLQSIQGGCPTRGRLTRDLMAGCASQRMHQLLAALKLVTGRHLGIVLELPAAERLELDGVAFGLPSQARMPANPFQSD